MLVLLHGLRTSTIATFDINLITMSNDMCVFSHLKFYNMSGKGDGETNLSMKNVTTVSPYGSPHKDRMVIIF